MTLPSPPTEPGVGPHVRHRRRQVQALALAAVAFAASAPGQSFLISVFVDDFIAGTGLSRTTFSALYAGGTIVSAVAMMLLGRVVDRRGLRVAWVLVALALAAACGMASLATGALVAFLALALLRTAGQGSFTLLGTLLVARSFHARRGQAVAVANLGVTLSSVVLPPVTALLIVTTDWRTAYQVLGAAIVLLVLPLALFVRVAEAHTDGDGPASHSTETSAAVRVTRAGLPNLPSAQAAMLLAILAAPPLIGTALTFHATSILAERGLLYLEAGGVVGLLGGASAAGVVVSGLVLDRIRTRTAMVLLSATILIATLVLLPPYRPSAYAAFVLLGLGMGATGVVNGTVWARTFGTGQLGRIQGVAQSSMITAAAVAPLVPALSLGLADRHMPGLIALAAIAAAALLLALFYREQASPSPPR